MNIDLCYCSGCGQVLNVSCGPEGYRECYCINCDISCSGNIDGTMWTTTYHTLSKDMAYHVTSKASFLFYNNKLVISNIDLKEAKYIANHLMVFL